MTQHPQTSSAVSIAAIPSSLDSLHGKRIKHTRIAEKMKEFETLIYPESQDSIVLVCGPTGVGKSTLAHYMVESAVRAASGAMDANAGLIPAIYVEAPSSGESDFSWRLLYQRILAQLEGEFPMRKENYGIDPVSGRLMKPRGATGNSLAAMRTAVERELRARSVQFLVIDEAAHIIRQSRRNRLEIQLDTLKSLANECGTQIVLVGSYDLYQLVSLSGQLARRSAILHFERYRQDKAEDVAAFTACVQRFQDALPTLWANKLIPNVEALHENTLGCIGTLSAVLTRAARLAQADGKWSLEALRRALLTEAQRTQILDEILDGEAAINPGLTRTMARPVASRVRAQSRSAA
ncbi:MAG: ATPase [Rhodocyclaceae bacterium]|nr:ATPase [Rhodocyclaceae bacterium]